MAKRKAKTKFYKVSLGYQDIGVGTLAQCQAAQRALDALTLVDCHWLDNVDSSKDRVLVESDRDDSCIVTRSEPVMTREEFKRESTLKIEHHPEVD